jgi:hypothetical protein
MEVYGAFKEAAKKAEFTDFFITLVFLQALTQNVFCW